MTFGLLANGVANIVKLFLTLRNGYLRLTGQSQVLGEQTQYLTMEQLDAAAAAHSLDQSHARLTQQFTAEASAVAQLIAAYQQATVAGQKFMLNNPGMMLPGARKGYANGVVSVPGSGNKDTVPAMLTPGEAVIPADMAKKYAPLINGMIAGNIPGYKRGLNSGDEDFSSSIAGMATSQVKAAEVRKFLDAELSRMAPELVAPFKELIAAVSSEIAVTVKNLKENLNVKEFRSQYNKNIGQQDELQFAHLDTGRRVKAGDLESSGAVVDPATQARLRTFIDAAGADALVDLKTGFGVELTGFLNNAMQNAGASLEDAITDFEIGGVEKWRKSVEMGGGNMQNLGDELVAFDTEFQQNLEQAYDQGARIVVDSQAQIEEMRQKALARGETFDDTVYVAMDTIAQQSRDNVLELGKGLDAVFEEAINRITEIRYQGLTPEQNAALPAGYGRGAKGGRITPSATDYGRGKRLIGDFRDAPLAQESVSNVDAAILATAQAAGTQSPSKRTIPIGEDIARGLEVGMANRQDDVEKSGSNLSAAAVKGTQNSRRVASRPEGAPTRTPGKRVRRTSSRPEGAPGANLSAVVANMPMSPQIQQAVIAEAKARESATQKMQRLDRSLMGASFAISSLSGMASMSGGKLGEMSGTISKVTGAMFALQAVTGLLTQSNLISLAQKRAETVGLIAGNVATKKMGLNTSLFSGGIKKLLPNLLRFGGIIAKFLGPIGIAISVITAGVSIIKYINNQREKERLAIEGLGNAALLSTDKLKTLGDFFGVVPTKSPLEQATTVTTVSAQERTKVDQLRGTESFQKDFGKDIKALRGATKKQAELVLKSISVQLRGKGFQQDQIETIITALKDEAGKTDVKLDFKSLDLSTDVGIATVTSDVNSLLNSYGKAFEDGYSSKVNNVISRATGETVSWTTETISKGLQKNVNTASKSIGGLMIGISGQFANGTINAEKFNQSFDGISNKIKNMPKPDSLFLMQNILKNLPSELAQSAAGIKNVSDQLLIAKAAALGVATITPEMVKQLKTAATSTDGGALRAASRVRGKINSDMKAIETLIETVVKSAKAKDFQNLGDGGSKKDGPLARAQDFIALQEQLIDMQSAPQLKKYNDELERQAGLLKDINKTIEARTEELITPLEATLKENAYLIDQISIKEDAINEQYDLQIKSLSEIKSINEDIASSEKERLSIAGALSSGDISAAASAVEEARARASATSLTRAESSLTKSRDLEIKALGRNELEKENKKIQLEIATIQREKIEPLNQEKIAIEKNITAQNDLKEALVKTVDLRKSEIKELGMTKTQIDEAAKALDLAQNPNVNINDPSFLPNVIKAALGDAYALKAALDAIAGKSKISFKDKESKDIKKIVKTKITDLSGYQDAIFRPGAGTGFAKGGLVPKYFAEGGFASGTDTVPAMLTPGEFVMSKSTVDKFGPMLAAINSPSFQMPRSESYSAGSSSINSVVDNSSAMYNYNIGITVPQSNASSGDIANAVISQIKYIDAQRIRGQR